MGRIGQRVVAVNGQQPIMGPLGAQKLRTSHQNPYEEGFISLIRCNSQA